MDWEAEGLLAGCADDDARAARRAARQAARRRRAARGAAPAGRRRAPRVEELPALRAAAADGYDWSYAGEKKLKGLASPLKTYRARPLAVSGD